MIVGLSGYARSGKDTVANHLVAKHGFVKLSFAEPLKEALYRLDPFLPRYWAGDGPDADLVRLAEFIDEYGWEAAKDREPEVRGLLQRMGTDVGRSLWGEGFWVEQARKRIHEDLTASYVLPDCRFWSEGAMVVQEGGVLWRVSRPGYGPVNDHPSEIGLDDWDPFDAHLMNDKTPAALCEHVDWLLEPA